jgi:hypothetical protein
LHPDRPAITEAQLKIEPFRSAIQRTAHGLTALFDDMGVNHGRAHIFVAQQFLDGTDIIAVLQKMGGKTVAQVWQLTFLFIRARFTAFWHDRRICRPANHFEEKANKWMHLTAILLRFMAASDPER